VCVVAATVSIPLHLIWLMEEEERFAEYAKMTRQWLIRGIVVLLLVPSPNTLAAIYFIPKIVNNPEIQKVAGDSLKILARKSQQYLEELADAE